MYVVSGPNRLPAGSNKFVGPKFDLPLKNITWAFYLPDGFKYDAFDGTLTFDEAFREHDHVEIYNLKRYEASVRDSNKRDVRKAMELQQRGNDLAQIGEQRAAKQALSDAWNYSFADPALNEDARVQLHRLTRQQAIVGLIGSRDRLRQQTGIGAEQQSMDLGFRFSQDDVERITSGLSKPDSENLELISERIIQMQEAAAAKTMQLAINMPLRGRVIQFTRSLQVEPNDRMEATFVAEPVKRRTFDRGVISSLCLALVLMVLLWAVPAAARGWERLGTTEDDTDDEPTGAAPARENDELPMTNVEDRPLRDERSPDVE